MQRKAGRPKHPEGAKLPVSLRLGSRLLADIDRLAMTDGRTRANMIEVMLVEAVDAARAAAGQQPRGPRMLPGAKAPAIME